MFVCLSTSLYVLEERIGSELIDPQFGINININ